MYFFQVSRNAKRSRISINASAAVDTNETIGRSSNARSHWTGNIYVNAILSIYLSYLFEYSDSLSQKKSDCKFMYHFGDKSDSNRDRKINMKCDLLFALLIFRRNR